MKDGGQLAAACRDLNEAVSQINDALDYVAQVKMIQFPGSGCWDVEQLLGTAMTDAVEKWLQDKYVTTYKETGFTVHHSIESIVSVPEDLSFMQLPLKLVLHLTLSH